ncbi:MAG: polysaccharide biosynthesis/export family protein [Pseudoflavonifractor sp.]|nr:polysaccharide biosynthesis/export family protein [Alloprevotella sp.]MCM1116586.1 polysaccharide biosynthesis/export family protein [Pseudoflavonifractor sp.]
MKASPIIRSLAAAAIIATAASCSTPKDVTYFQDVAEGYEVTPSNQLNIRVKPEDKLSILVTTQDPALSTLFNLVQSQNRLGQTTSATNAAPSQQSAVSYYTVDPLGNITFPVVGSLHVGGMRRHEVAQFIERELKEKDLVKDPIVTVEFANTGISVIGEVNDPGRFEFNKDELNIIDAIAMAGDLTPNGQRQNVVVLREEPDGKRKAYRIDLTNMTEVASSPVFFLQQNDVIYVEPNDKKKRDTTSSGNTSFAPSFWVSVGSLAVTIATLIITLTN